MKFNTNTKFISKKSFNCYLFEEKERLQMQNLNKHLKEGGEHYSLSDETIDD